MDNEIKSIKAYGFHTLCRYNFPIRVPVTQIQIQGDIQDTFLLYNANVV